MSAMASGSSTSADTSVRERAEDHKLDNLDGADGKSEQQAICSPSHSQQEMQNDGDDSQQASVSSDSKLDVSHMSKRAQKKLRQKEKLKEFRKAKQASKFTKNSSPGFNSDIFGETDYYFENGLRKVYPYPYTFSTYAKERWYGRTIQDIFEHEFRVDSPDNFRTSVSKGKMSVNGKVVGLDYVLRNGDLIEHRIHRHENPVCGTPIEILEDTEEVVVINKPASIPCHPCGKFRFNSIVFIMGKEYGYANLRNIYRLDRLTSGVLIMGKTARKTKELENHVLHRRVHKEYVARVVGEFPPEEVTVDQPLDCLSHKLTLWRVVQKGGKPSRTTFQRLGYNGTTSVVRCIPHTGRTHQIRVHLQYLGHPIVNDPYYNSPSWGPQRGKGGHCDVSHEELCQRIMQEHNVGQWCEGENPLFKERMSATNTYKEPSLLGQQAEINKEAGYGDAGITTVNTPNSISGDTETVTVNTAVKQNEACGDMSADISAPPSKRPRLVCDMSSTNTSDSVGQKVSVSDAHGAVSLSVTHTSDAISMQSVTHTPNTGTKHADGEPCHKIDISTSPAIESANFTASTVKTGIVTEQEMESSIQGEIESSISGETGSSVKGLKDVSGQRDGDYEREEGRGRKVLEQRGFDPQRWVPDPLCESCRLKYMDPKPTDLLLYLHALRYKGPTWDYSTALPKWAAEDWEEPEDYHKYLQ